MDTDGDAQIKLLSVRGHLLRERFEAAKRSHNEWMASFDIEMAQDEREPLYEAYALARSSFIELLSDEPERFAELV